MKKLFSLSLVVFSLTTASCGLFSETIDPTTEQKAYDNLREIFEEIISEGPKDPWDPKGEFETKGEYQVRLSNQQGEYFDEAERYYGKIEQRTFILLYEIDELGEFNADLGQFEIPYQMTSFRLSGVAERIGPEFRLFIPQGVTEEIHLFNEDFLEESEIIMARNGGFSKLTFFANVNREKARELREAAENLGVYLRMGIQFEFPEAFQGYRFLPTRYDAYEEEESLFPSPYVEKLMEEDLNYAANEGEISVKVVLVELVDADGVIHHKWPEGLMPAQTPTVSPTETPTPFPTLVLPLEPTKETMISPTQHATGEAPFCPQAPEPRMIVGQKGRVAYGDPSRVRVRVGPTTSAAILRLISPGKEFLVIGGPVCADGYIWWQIEFDQYSGYWVAEGEEGNYFIEPQGGN